MTKRKFQTQDEYYIAEMHRRIATLPKAQQRTLKSYVQFYSNKPSPQGGLIKPKSVLNNVEILQKLGLYLKKDYKKATLKNLKDFFIARNGKAETSLAYWKIVVRYFYKWLYGGRYIKKKGLFPPVVDDPIFETRRKPTSSRIQNKEDLLTKDEVIKLIKHALSHQDRTKIMLLAESGIRAGEIVSLNKQSVTFDDYGAKIWVPKSKSKKRYVRVVDSVPLLKDWLNEHALNRPDAPLFYGQGSYFGERLNSKAITQMLKKCARRAKIDEKKTFAHGFRHVSVTSCKTNLKLDVDCIAKRHGITAGTVRDVYLHYFDDDADKDYRDALGLGTEEEQIQRQEAIKKTAPKKCQCGHINPFNAHYCKKCGSPIDLETAIHRDLELNKQLMTLQEQMAEVRKDMAKYKREKVMSKYSRDELKR